MSCASPGSCAAGGYYRDRRSQFQGFVVSQRRGRWGTAIEVPGLGNLNKAYFAEVLSVSCASAGNCAAGGYYQPRRTHDQGFVVSERRGRWGTAIEVPGLGALNTGGRPGHLSVVRLGGQLRGRRVLPGPPQSIPGVRGQPSSAAAGARRSTCPAWGT